MDRTIEKIALTGFMGSGKSTIGRMVAQQLGWAFVDIDSEIERIHACSASSLFQEVGEARFRAVEAQIMAMCLAPSNTVVALVERRWICRRTSVFFVTTTQDF